MGILENLDTAKTHVPAGFRYQAAREFFRECDCVDTNIDLKWQEPDFEGLRNFLVDQNQFSEERVQRTFQRLKAAKSKTKQQPLSRFFGTPTVTVREDEKFDPNKKKNAAASAKAKAKAKAKTKAGAPVSDGTQASGKESESVPEGRQDASQQDGAAGSAAASSGTGKGRGRKRNPPQNDA